MVVVVVLVVVVVVCVCVCVCVGGGGVGRVARTHLAATYPPELCEAWAGLSFASGELGAEGSRQPVSFLSQ